jgi:hypothetical protein
VNSEEDELEIAARNSTQPSKNIAVLSKRNPPFDKSGFAKLCSEAGCLILLLRLKGFLRETYNLSESRCSGFNPDAKEVGEKPILKSSTSSVFDSKLLIHNDIDDRLDAMITMYAEFRRLTRKEISDSSYLDDDESDAEIVIQEEEEE